MTQAKSLQKKLQKGGLLDLAGLSQADVSEAAQALSTTMFVVDCDRARSRSAVLRAIAKAVDFPEFFGSNLDALYDCLCDTIQDQKTGMFLWLHNLHSGDPALQQDAVAIADVCIDASDFAGNNERVFGFGIVHLGKHPDPEPGIEPTPYPGASVAE